MAFEDRRGAERGPWRPGPDGPLDVFGPLARLPSPPAGASTFSAPSPAPFADDRLRVHVSRARGSPRATAILVPPWKIPSRRLLAGWVRMLCRAGFDTWIYVPPHHLERRPAGARSGHGFVSPDLGRIRSALAQSVLELRACAALAGEAGPVAVVGLSLGALVAAWAATGPEALDATALVAPPADLAAVLRHTRIGARYGRAAADAGGPLPGPSELEARLRPLVPLDRRPTSRRVLVAAGVEDRIALSGPSDLATAWGVPLRAYPRGHMTLLFACAAARRDVSTFLSGPLASAES